MTGDNPCYANLVIDRDTASSSPAEFSRPNLENLRSFRIIHHTVNIIEEIGVKYRRFGVSILNDLNGHYVSSIEAELLKNAENINTRILEEWIGGREGAKPVEWKVLATTLHDIGLQAIAREIRTTLNLN